jgi:hypothetical protein
MRWIPDLKHRKSALELIDALDASLERARAATGRQNEGTINR